MMLWSALLGCDGKPITTVPPGEMPIYDIKRNPVIWMSDTIYSTYNPTDSIATIRLPRMLLDTSHADDILISYELYEWPECDVLDQSTSARFRVLCPSLSDLWWGGRFEIALSGFNANPKAAFVNSSDHIRVWSRDNPRAWANLVRYRESYQPLLLNKSGRDVDWYTDVGRLQLSADSDGVWIGWWTDLDLAGCPGYGPNLTIDTLVKIDATGERIDLITIHDVPVRDYTVDAGCAWVLTPEPDQRIVAHKDGEIVGDFRLDKLGYYGYSSLNFVEDTLWTAETHLTEEGWQLKLRQFAFTTSAPKSSPMQLDSLIFSDYIDVDPTWDGEAFVYWTYGSNGQMLTRRDRAGRVIESVRSRLYLSGDVCGALGSYWVTHHGPYGAISRGVFLSRIEF